MAALPARRGIFALVGALCVFVALMACGGSGSGQGSFASNQREVIPTNVIGKSDTSGIGPGASLSSSGGAAASTGASPTASPTLTPAPSK